MITKNQFRLLAVAGAIIAYLLYVAGSSFIAIHGAAELTPADRGQAMMVHVVLPLIGAASVVGMFGAIWFVLGSSARTDETTKPAPPPPSPPKRDAPRPVESSATVITLREPNIDLSITLTGNAAKDAVGRKKIGAVMEHYGSGAVTENAASLDPIPGPSIPAKVTSKITAPVFPVAPEGGAV